MRIMTTAMMININCHISSFSTKLPVFKAWYQRLGLLLVSAADPGLPGGWVPTPSANLLFGPMFPKVAWKWRGRGEGTQHGSESLLLCGAATEFIKRENYSKISKFVRISLAVPDLGGCCVHFYAFLHFCINLYGYLDTLAFPRSKSRWLSMSCWQLPPARVLHCRWSELRHQYRNSLRVLLHSLVHPDLHIPPL